MFWWHPVPLLPTTHQLLCPILTGHLLHFLPPIAPLRGHPHFLTHSTSYFVDSHSYSKHCDCRFGVSHSEACHLRPAGTPEVQSKYLAGGIRQLPASNVMISSRIGGGKWWVLADLQKHMKNITFIIKTSVYWAIIFPLRGRSWEGWRRGSYRGVFVFSLCLDTI